MEIESSSDNGSMRMHVYPMIGNDVQEDRMGFKAGTQTYTVQVSGTRETMVGYSVLTKRIMSECRSRRVVGVNLGVRLLSKNISFKVGVVVWKDSICTWTQQ